MRQKTSNARKLSIYGFQLAENGHNFFALLDFDVTELREYLRSKRRDGEGGSLFAFLLKAIAKCLEEFPSFNAMIDLRKTTYFETVDIGIPIEVANEQGAINRQYIVKDAARKSIGDISAEIDAAKENLDRQEGFILSPSMRAIISRLPRFIVSCLFRILANNHGRVKELSGSVFVTSVSMFSTAPGYVVPYIGGPKASSFAIGSVAEKPVVRKGEIVIREMLNITAVFNHDIIDGAPAARFINRLKRYIESEYKALS
jgi:pyruvate/2-oxoglutarate dehydrogenase complex dihydrolipoamide acyltransferase (E2) component